MRWDEGVKVQEMGPRRRLKTMRDGRIVECACNLDIGRIRRGGGVIRGVGHCL